MKEFNSLNTFKNSISILHTNVFLTTSCTPTDDEPLIMQPTLELDGRLPMDNNGYYRLELSDTSFQPYTP